jgi:HPt (histidine-containing phosphotransfer) domain-containing protein
MQSLPLPLQFDPDRLRRLLDLVGPTEAQAFLTQLDEDLSDCASRIAAASARQDWTALREASHVLVSLAGSAGALSLQAVAEALNAAAHARNTAALTDLHGQLAPDLSRLIALVRATPDPFAGSR